MGAATQSFVQGSAVTLLFTGVQLPNQDVIRPQHFIFTVSAKPVDNKIQLTISWPLDRKVQLHIAAIPYLCLHRYVSNVSKRQALSMRTTSSLHSWDISSHISIQLPLKASEVYLSKNTFENNHCQRVTVQSIKRLVREHWLLWCKRNNHNVQRGQNDSNVVIMNFVANDLPQRFRFVRV